MWAEVFSRSDQRWIPVDTVRGTIRKKSHFEPVGDGGPVRMTYVMAFEEGVSYSHLDFSFTLVISLTHRRLRSGCYPTVHKVIRCQNVKTEGPGKEG